MCLFYLFSTKKRQSDWHIFDGAPGGGRTHDHELKRLLLYH